MLGEELAKKYNNFTYVHTDFKKNNGQDIGVDLSKKIGIYRQCFCGCEFSKKYWFSLYLWQRKRIQINI